MSGRLFYFLGVIALSFGSILAHVARAAGEILHWGFDELFTKPWSAPLWHARDHPGERLVSSPLRARVAAFVSRRRALFVHRGAPSTFGIPALA